jgi:hypothetical protein
MYIKYINIPLLKTQGVSELETTWNNRTVWVKLGVSCSAQARSTVYTVITAHFNDVRQIEYKRRVEVNRGIQPLNFSMYPNLLD